MTLKQMLQVPIFVVFLCYCSISFAQNNNAPLFSKADLPTPIIGSPEATSLGKYGEVPVSLFSGQADISIPILDFVSGDISVPIKLQYNTGGIRVNDIATAVGLGWSLSAGGVVTRVQNGAPDEANNIGTFPENFDPNNAGPNLNNPDYLYAQMLINEQKDFERDSYFFNFLNQTGKIQKNYQGEVRFFPANPDIKVVHNQNSILITDDKGFKYYFEATEGNTLTPVCTIGVPGPSELQNSLTGFFLTKIVSPSNHQVVLEYETYSYKLITNSKEVIYQRSALNGCPEIVANNRKCDIVQEFFAQRIKRITSSINTTVVEFSYSTTKRSDMKFNGQDQGNSLEHIYLKSNGATLRTWDFDYAYFGSGESKRLKLLSIKAPGQPPYQFYYGTRKHCDWKRYH